MRHRSITTLGFGLFILVSLHDLVLSLDNGVARTPPMGWLTWERFMCNTDCKRDPENCISETLMKQQADLMVELGFKDAGYEYVIVDDCWPNKEGRDPETGKLQADPERFPSGMKALGDYIHGLGLKYGIYEDYGTKTCGGYPGVLGHEELDAQTLAEWGADYIKLDGCYSDPETHPQGYPEFGKYLNQTGRPIVYSCSWPAYASSVDIEVYKDMAKHCNLWRNWDDIGDSWRSVKSIINWFATNQDNFTSVAGPGNWNDPDMIIVGNFGLSIDQSRVQMAIWSILAAPLIMSNDLRRISQEHVELLQNKQVIKINQDPMGIAGKRIRVENNNMHFFVRPIMPSFKGNMSAAVALLNTYEMGSGYLATFTPKSIGLEHANGYAVTEVFENKFMQNVLPNQYITIRVNPSGVQFLRFDVKPSTTWMFKEKNRMASRSQQLGEPDIQITDLSKTGLDEDDMSWRRVAGEENSCEL